MSEEEKKQILAEIIKLTEPPTIRPTDVTLRDYIAATGASRHAARYRLEQLVTGGGYETLLVFSPERHRMLRVWRRVEV